jgi:hypothetical protein
VVVLALAAKLVMVLMAVAVEVGQVTLVILMLQAVEVVERVHSQIRLVSFLTTEEGQALKARQAEVVEEVELPPPQAGMLRHLAVVAF